MPKRREPFDLTCLKALKLDADSERVALCAASIVVHAHAMARAAPETRADAMRIVDLARRFYAVMPTRGVVEAMVDEALSDYEASGPGRRDRARRRLVDRLFDYIHRGPG